MFLLKVNDSVDSINFTELLNKFVLILNHGYGMNIICNNKSKLNINKTKENLINWKNMNYGLINAEFQYLYVERKIFAEKFLSDNSIDYKNFCFNGETKFIRITKLLNDKNNTYLHNHYDLNWKLNELENGLRGYKRNPNIIIEKTKKCKINVKIC